MSVERIIGIDYGTSTSVVKIKTYKNNQALDSREMADYVRFDNKDSLPTLVYETTDGRYLVGYEAENAAVKGVLHQNFKLDLISPDLKIREEAVRYTEVFLK
jgi:molecular chaperone DnaK (HSP70)